MSTQSVGMTGRHGPRNQRGMIATLLAIIVLVVTVLAAVALMRSVDTSNTIAGRVAFRQTVIQEAALAYEDAKAKIIFNEPTSDNNVTNLGYYATPQAATVRTDKDLPDVLVNETAGGIGTVLGVTSGDKVFYVVERLCPNIGPADPKTCIVPGASIQGGSVSNQTKDNGPPFTSGAYAAFRLSVKVVGPKNTVGYVQSVMR